MMNLEYAVNHNKESGKRTKVCRAEAKQAATQRLLERGERGGEGGDALKYQGQLLTPHLSSLPSLHTSLLPHMLKLKKKTRATQTLGESDIYISM